MLFLLYGDQIIVNRGKWLASPANIKEANKEAKIEVGRYMTVHFALIKKAKSVYEPRGPSGRSLSRFP